MDQVISVARVVMLVLFFVAGLGVGFLAQPPVTVPDPVVLREPCPEPPKCAEPVKCPEPPAKRKPTYRVIPPRTFDR